MHEVLTPSASIDFASGPGIGTLPMQEIIHEVTLVKLSGGPFKKALTVFLTVGVVAEELSTVGPLFLTLAVL